MDLEYVLKVEPASGYYYSYFTGKETKAQANQTTCPESHSQWGAELEFQIQAVGL